MNAARPGRPAQVDAVNTVPARDGRLRDAVAKRGVPLAAILVTVAVVVLVYLAGKLAYRIRDVLLMIAVAGFVSLILNPLVGPLAVAYATANIASAIPLTPGGLGIIEVTLVAVTVGFGAPRATAVLAVLGYRTVNYWLPLISPPPGVANTRRQ